MTYHGVKFRSTLEADWAATFDSLGWYWEYEPVALDLGQGRRYLCDFRLPHQRVWCEVKGPHNERIEKAKALDNATDDLVVILRPSGPGGIANWESVVGRYVAIHYCPTCAQWSFISPADNWICRRGCATEVDVCIQFVPAGEYLEVTERFREKDGWPYGQYGKLMLQRARDSWAPWTRS
jgi:hypothetical protein